MPYTVQFCRFPGSAHEYFRCTGWIAKTVMKMSQDPRIASIEPHAVVDTPITMSRNRTVKHALDRNIDYILMVDSDMFPDVYEEQGAPAFWDVAWNFMMKRREEEPKWLKILESEGTARDATDLQRMAAKALAPATIAAPYCGPPPHENVFIFEWKGFSSDDPSPIPFKLDQLTREQAAHRSGIQEVPALPTGVILYDARVFQKLPPPWFSYEYRDEYQTEKVTTEDVYQTRNASMLGLPQYVAWDCWAGHVKLKVVGRPTSLTCDMVNAQLAAAIKAGWETGKTIKYSQPSFEDLMDGQSGNGELDEAVIPAVE